MLRKRIVVGMFVGTAVVSMFGCYAESSEEEDGEEQRRTEAEIVGGTVTDAEPAVGALVWLKNEVCTGFVVTPRIVMTAGHCGSNTALPDGFFTGPGSRVTKKPSTLAEIKNLDRHLIDAKVVHPQYKGGLAKSFTGTLAAFQKKMTNDVALLKLAEPIGEGIAPVKLAAKPPAARSTKCTAIGYGLDAEKGVAGGLRKRSATVNAAPGLTFIEVTRGTGEPAPGDSGSPLLCNGEATGVYSFFYANTGQNDRDFYQRATEMRDWVNKTAASWGVAALAE